MSQWINITDDLTEEAIKDLQVGQVLMFKDGEQENNLRIMRKRNGKVWVKHVVMYRPHEVEVVDKVE